MAQHYLVDCGPTGFGGLGTSTIWWTLTWCSLVDCGIALCGDCGTPVALNLWFVLWGLCFIICPPRRAYMQQCPGQLTYTSHSVCFSEPLIQPFLHLCIHAFIHAFTRVHVPVHICAHIFPKGGLVFCFQVYRSVWQCLLLWFYIFK